MTVNEGKWDYSHRSKSENESVGDALMNGKTTDILGERQWEMVPGEHMSLGHVSHS